MTQRSADKVWLDSVVEHLRRLEYCEQMARCGCENIIDYSELVSNYNTRQLADVSSKVQLKNSQLFLNESLVLFSKSKPLLGEKAKDIEQKINKAKELLDEGIEFSSNNYQVKGVFSYAPTHPDRRDQYIVLNPRYSIALNLLYQIRSNFIEALWVYLDPSTSRDEKP